MSQRETSRLLDADDHRVRADQALADLQDLLW
jgi:hypothetical protein